MSHLALIPAYANLIPDWQQTFCADGSSSAITTESWREKHAPRPSSRGAQKTYTSDSGVSDAGTSTAGATGKVIKSDHGGHPCRIWAILIDALPTPNLLQCSLLPNMSRKE